MLGLSDCPDEVLVAIAGCFVLSFLVIGRTTTRRVSGTHYNLFVRDVIPDRVRRRALRGLPPLRPPGQVGGFARVYCLAVCQWPSISQTRLFLILRERNSPDQAQQLPAIPDGDGDGSDRGRECSDENGIASDSSGPPPLAGSSENEDHDDDGDDDDVEIHYRAGSSVDGVHAAFRLDVVPGSHLPDHMWAIDTISEDWVSIMGTPREPEAEGDECEEFGESDESEVDIFPYGSEDGGRDGNGDGNDEESEESD